MASIRKQQKLVSKAIEISGAIAQQSISSMAAKTISSKIIMKNENWISWAYQRKTKGERAK